MKGEKVECRKGRSQDLSFPEVPEVCFGGSYLGSIVPTVDE